MKRITSFLKVFAITIFVAPIVMPMGIAAGLNNSNNIGDGIMFIVGILGTAIIVAMGATSGLAALVGLPFFKIFLALYLLGCAVFAYAVTAPDKK